MPQHRSIDQPSRSPAHARLRFTAQGLRLISAGYAAWVLSKILRWWLDPKRVAREMGNYFQRDLTGMAGWQPLAALGLDLLAWGVLLAAVVHG